MRVRESVEGLGSGDRRSSELCWVQNSDTGSAGPLLHHSPAGGDGGGLDDLHAARGAAAGSAPAPAAAPGIGTIAPTAAAPATASKTAPAAAAAGIAASVTSGATSTAVTTHSYLAALHRCIGQGSAEGQKG